MQDMYEYVKFNGRSYIKEDTVYFNWSLSGFEFCIYGTAAEALLVTNLGYNGTSPDHNCLLWVYVDGDTAGRKLIELDEPEKWYMLAEGLPEGFHHIQVIKRTQLGYSMAGVKDLRVNGRFADRPITKARKIEVIGDSFSCGDGCYTVAGENVYGSQNQDAMVSFSALIADHFQAEVQVIAKCGIGLVWDYAGKTVEDETLSIPLLYPYTDYLYAGEQEVWDFQRFEPELILLNIGTNDASRIPRDVERWVNTYVAFLKTLREKNPKATILCTQGASNFFSDHMHFDQIKAEIEVAGIRDVLFYQMKADYDEAVDGKGIGMHPTPATHRKTADQLIAEIDRLAIYK